MVWVGRRRSGRRIHQLGWYAGKSDARALGCAFGRGATLAQMRRLALSLSGFGQVGRRVIGVETVP